MDPDIKSLFDELQIPPLDAELLDGEPPEPVDEERLRAFFAGELDRPQEVLLCHLMANYRVWYDASQEFVRQEQAQRVALAAAASEDASAEGAGAPLGGPGPTGDAVVKKIGDYLGRTADALLAEMMRLVPGDLAAARSAGALAPYLDDLRRLICYHWNWAQRRRDPALQDPAACAEAIRELIASSNLRLPFPPELVAAYLVKEGLDRLCD